MPLKRKILIPMKKILLFAFLLTAGHLFAQDASRVSLFKVSDGFIQSGGSFDGGFGYGGYYEPYYSSFGGPYGEIGRAHV